MPEDVYRLYHILYIEKWGGFQFAVLVHQEDNSPFSKVSVWRISFSLKRTAFSHLKSWMVGLLETVSF